MKFISKSSNYMIVLRPGIPANPITGTAAIAGLSVRFKDGVAEVKDQDTVDKMMVSDGFTNGEFIAVDDSGQDPFAYSRVGTEPQHVVEEIQFGHVVGRKVSEPTTKLPPAVQAYVQEEAVKMAQLMAPEMAKQIAKDILPGMMKEMLAEMAAKDQHATSATDEPVSEAPKTPKTPKK